MMNVLRAVSFVLPDKPPNYFAGLLSAVNQFGEIQAGTLTLSMTNSSYLPSISLSTGDRISPAIRFQFDTRTYELDLTNETGESRTSFESYEPIELDDYLTRARELPPEKLDHLGFNLPWFDGTHPKIAELRRASTSAAAYYRFPTGEDWDFVLPATQREIIDGELDLETERRPKLEIVSFEKSSLPLVQFDFMVRRDFASIAALFPEGIKDEKLENVWVYLANPYCIDICMVINAYREGDWCSFFDGHRLT